jgi:hypothetical protein
MTNTLDQARRTLRRPKGLKLLQNVQNGLAPGMRETDDKIFNRAYICALQYQALCLSQQAVSFNLLRLTFLAFFSFSL